jgi:Transcriptional regulators
MRDRAVQLDPNRSMDKMTVAQERVLGVVFQKSPEGVKLKDIAKCVNLSPGAVSQIIEMLVKEGLVERNSDPSDRRAVNIHVTAKSKLVRDHVVAAFDDVIRSVLEERTPEERETFTAILERIVERFSSTRESVRRHSGETLLSMEEYK